MGVSDRRAQTQDSGEVVLSNILPAVIDNFTPPGRDCPADRVVVGMRALDRGPGTGFPLDPTRVDVGRSREDVDYRHQSLVEVTLEVRRARRYSVTENPPSTSARAARKKPLKRFARLITPPPHGRVRLRRPGGIHAPARCESSRGP